MVIDMRKLVLVGGGGHCKSVLDSAYKMNVFSEIVITDPQLPIGSKILDSVVVGNDEIMAELKKNGFTDAFVSVGSITDLSIRRKLTSMITNCGFNLPSIIDPSAIVSEYVTIGKGTFVGKSVVINADARVGNHCIINTGCVLEHESTVNDFTHISVGTILCGNVRVGSCSFIGAGSTIAHGVSIGNNTTIGAGSVVLTDITDSMKVYGVVTKRRMITD